MHRQTPEGRELDKKKAELVALENVLARRELELATFEAELHAFEWRYLTAVGLRYAELDEIEAQIAEAQATLKPLNNIAYARARQARFQAHESARAIEQAQTGLKQFQASDNLRKLYREIAKRFHPDFATDTEDRIRRTRLMAAINHAYEEADEARMLGIIRQWEDSPEAVQGEGIGAELVRVIRKIAHIEERLRAIDSKMDDFSRSDLYQLKRKVDEAEIEARDLLAEMAAHVEGIIADARNRLSELTKQQVAT